MTIWQSIAAFFNTIWTEIKGVTPVPVTPPTVTPVPNGPPIVTPPTQYQKLVTLITSKNGPAGPYEGTGGEIFANTPAQTASLATAMIAAVNSAAGVTLPLIASLVYGESKFSLLAIDPNLDKIVVPPKTRQDYTDYGPAQINYSNFNSYPDLVGLSVADQIATVQDPAWCMPVVSEILADLIAWGKSVDTSIRSLSRMAPSYGTPLVLGLDAYNRGKSGSAFAAICQQLTIFAVTTGAEVVALTSDIDPTTVGHTLNLATNAYLAKNPGATVPTWDTLVAYFAAQPPDDFSYGNGVASCAVTYATDLGD